MSVVVVGSANIDVVLNVHKMPGAGETVLSKSRSMFGGGKGLNQAVAVARAGSEVTFIGRVGRDEAGDTLLGILELERVAHLVAREKEPTGTAFVVVDSSGENLIIVSPGANAEFVSLDAADFDAVASAELLLLQLEIPLSAVLDAARAARAANVRVLLNAAPARHLPQALLELVDVLIVNEHEALIVSEREDSEGVGANTVMDGARAAVSDLLRTVPSVVVTMGDRGALVGARESNESRIVHIDAPHVHVVDSTGAGDTFCGAFASELGRGSSLAAAAQFAVAAGSLAVQIAGAVPSIPSRAAIQSALRGSVPIAARQA